MSSATPNRPARGRKNPALLQPEGEQGPSIELEPMDDHADEQDLQPEGTYLLLLDEGDVITTGMTQPVILEGHIKETYIHAKVTTRVREDEPAEIAAARARTVVFGSVLDQIEEAEEGYRQMAEDQAARLARAGVTPR